jgi:low temperature requirement protein LtrA
MARAIIDRAGDPGRLARLAYTYVHLVIVAGIVVVAVGDEFVLTHPNDAAGPGVALAVAGGPALYLFGILLFKLSMVGRVSLQKTLGVAALALLGFAHASFSALALATAATAILILVGAWETAELKRAAALAPAERAG